LIAWRALQAGLGKLKPDAETCARDLGQAWEVLGEAIQTVLRAHGVPDGYELLKNFTRGAATDEGAVRAFIATLLLPAEARARLAALKPADYIGLAAELALALPD
jgi:adenylosuccinate lyase